MVGKHRQPQRYAYIYIFMYTYIYIHVVLSLLLCFTKIFMGLQWLSKSYWKYQMWQRWSFWVVSAAFFCLVSAHRLSCGHQKWWYSNIPSPFCGTMQWISAHPSIEAIDGTQANHLLSMVEMLGINFQQKLMAVQTVVARGATRPQNPHQCEDHASRLFKPRPWRLKKCKKPDSQLRPGMWYRLPVWLWKKWSWKDPFSIKQHGLLDRLVTFSDLPFPFSGATTQRRFGRVSSPANKNQGWRCDSERGNQLTWALLDYCCYCYCCC